MSFKWNIVTTVHAPSWMIVQHAIYHRGLGVNRIIYFIDNPSFYTSNEISEISTHAEVILCDNRYWSYQKDRPSSLPYRQILNLSVAQNILKGQWILHIDIDEFLHTSKSYLDTLIDLPQEVSEIRVDNVERVLSLDSKNWTEGCLRVKNFSKEALLKHYKEKTPFFGFGLSHYFHGKSFVLSRNGVLQNVHGAARKEYMREIIRFTTPLNNATLVHYPLITPTHFINRYLHFLTHKSPAPIEFTHQRKLRQYLVEATLRIGPINAINHAMRFMHFYDKSDMDERLTDGLYISMPNDFIKRINASALDSDHINLSWADRSFHRFMI